MIQLPLAKGYRADSVVAWRRGAVITLNQLLSDIPSLANALADRPYVINLCEDRYRFLTGFAAAMVRGQVSLLPSARTAHVLHELAEAYPDLYCLSESRDGIPDDLMTVIHHTADTAVTAVMPEFPADQLAAIVFTSGSTGQA